MAKKFTNESELLEEHHTQLIRTDTTAQSNKNVDIDFLTVINEAKQLIREEQSSNIKDKDILEIQNSIKEYSKELEKYKQSTTLFESEDFLDINKENSSRNLCKSKHSDILQIQNYIPEYKKDLELIYKQSVTHLSESKKSLKKNKIVRLCESKEKIKWNDDIFDTPNPKNNKAFLRDIAIGRSSDEIKLLNSESDEIEIEKLTNEIFNKYKFLENTQTNCELSKSEINLGSTESILTGTEKEKIEYIIHYKLENDYYNPKKNDEKNKCEENYSDNNGTTDDEENKIEEKHSSIKEIPELNITNYSDYKEIPDEAGSKIQEKHSSIKEIPELKITPQKVKKMYVEVKKLSIENMESTQNFDQDSQYSNNKEIQTLETRITQSKNKLATHTIEQWRNFVKTKQERRKEEIEKKKQAQKIDSFVEKLEGFKKEMFKQIQDQENLKSPIPKSNTNLKLSKVSNFEHRFKAQKDIIEMQKKKLVEQNRIIEELKQKKIHEEARESLENARTIIQKSFYQKLPRKTVKKQEVEFETQCSKPDPLNLVLKLQTVPRNIKTMEERARERQEKRMLIQERKRLLDEEKKRLLEEAVLRKAKEEQEQKQERMDKLKRQRNAVRQMELKKQQEKQRYIELTESAHQHYKNKLKKIGLDRLKFLVYNLKIKFEISKRFYENNIIIKCFKSWHVYTSEIINNKNKLAIDLFSKKLLHKSWSCWKSYQFQIIQMGQVAVDRYEMSLQSRYFNEWRKISNEYKAQFTANAKKADKYYKRSLLFHCLENWRSLPAIMQIERIQNERKRKWRLRVAEILSDYDPLKNYEV